MVWILIALLALACCAVLYAAGRTPRHARPSDPETPDAQADAATRFYREQLKGLERDEAQGRLDAAEARAARIELAREYLRQSRETAPASGGRGAGRAVLLAIPLAVLLSFGTYIAVGRGDLPALPLAEREAEAIEAQRTLEEAVRQVEARLAETPDDVRGWQVLAPVYLGQQRYPEAIAAFRRVLDLGGADADTETDLAEAIILGAGGGADPEAIALLTSAAERDPEHVRSRFYLASVLTRAGEFDAAVPIWTRLIAIGLGNESWYPAAQSGLATARAGVAGEALGEPGGVEVTDEMILGMVAGLADRLYDAGGSAEEWTRLVQARLVLGDRDAAQADFEAGLAALEGEARMALQAFGEAEGLTVQETNN